MVRFPAAKINLGLNVVRRREDGYHDIETVMVPIPLTDMLEVVVDDALDAGEVQFSRSGIPIPCDPQQDLCSKAIRAMQAHVALPGLRVHLHKVIPTGAGLGGGSSDAACMLMLLNDLIGAAIPTEELRSIAAGLGSDCPFFLDARPQLATGRGEQLKPVSIDLNGKWILVVNPGIHIPTPEVYRATTASGRSYQLEKLLQQPMEKWQATVVNDMEDHVLAKHVAVASIKERLIATGALYSAMSGSGSTVFGLFHERPPLLEWPHDHTSWLFQLH